MKRIKTRPIERRTALLLSGTKAGVGLLGNRASTWCLSDDKKAASRNKALKKQAEKYVATLGKLKGSYVKIGQMMALFGEHLLPRELTDALHTLEDQTQPLDWAVLKTTVESQLGEKLNQLSIEETPLAAASIGQVHRGVIKATGEQLCLKIQYPGIQDSIESDFSDVKTLLKVAKLVKAGREIDAWLDELQKLLREEVDYSREAEQTLAMAKRLENDERYCVPKVYWQFSTPSLLTLEYLEGYDVTAAEVQNLSLERRNHLAGAMLELFFKEIFEWGVLQADPNFGNYRIQLAEQGETDKIVLLDFGAVRGYSEDFLKPLRKMIVGAYNSNLDQVIEGAIALKCVDKDDPDSVKQSFASFCISLLEPLQKDFSGVPDYALNDLGQYRWKQSKLIKRAGKLATKSAASFNFSLPPKEFTLIARKLTGVFTFISTLGAEFNGRSVIEPYIEGIEF